MNRVAIETAVELTEGRTTGTEVQTIIDLGKGMRERPVEPIAGVDRVLERLSHDYELMVITKRDLFDQETKLARSGLGQHFAKAKIVSEKDVATYREILRRNRILPEHFLMVGNSVKFDVLPVVELGASAIHIPYRLTWEHEKVEGAAPETHGYVRLNAMTDLPGWLGRAGSSVPLDTQGAEAR